MAVADRRYNKQEDNMAEFKIETNLAEIGNKQIEANYDEALATVREIVAPYTALVVTPDTIRQAAGDRARLRKMRAALDDYRKTAKAECMKPYTAFEERMKPIFAAIDKAVENIDGQVKAFEAAAEQEKLNELHAFFDSQLTDETREIADWDKIRDPRWKNKTFSVVDAHNAIIMALGGIERDMKALRNYPEPYKSVMIEKYGKEYRLSDAIGWYTETMAREAERKRREEEAAQRAAEEAARKEEAARAARMTQELSNNLAAQFPVQTAETPTQPPVVAERPKERAYPRRVEFWVVIETKEQGKALAAFLKGNGIEFGAINKEG